MDLFRMQLVRALREMEDDRDRWRESAEMWFNEAKKAYKIVEQLQRGEEGESRAPDRP